MNKARTPQSVSSIKATLKRFDEEEAALHEQLSGNYKAFYKLQLKRSQARGRLKKAEERARNER